VRFAVFYETKPIGAYHRTRMDNHTISNLNSGVDHNLRMKHTIGSNAAVSADIGTRFEKAPLPDDSSGVNDRKRTDPYVFSNPRIGCDYGAGMNTGIVPVFLKQQRGRSRKREFRITNNDRGSASEFTSADNHAARAAVLYLFVELFFRVAEIGRPGVFQTGDRTERHVSAAAKFADDVLGDFLSCMFHE
jgi:hypothetical protein